VWRRRPLLASFASSFSSLLSKPEYGSWGNQTSSGCFCSCCYTCCCCCLFDCGQTTDLLFAAGWNAIHAGVAEMTAPSFVVATCNNTCDFLPLSLSVVRMICIAFDKNTFPKSVMYQCQVILIWIVIKLLPLGIPIDKTRMSFPFGLI